MMVVYLRREIFSLSFIASVLLSTMLMIFFVFMDYKNNYSNEMGLYYFLRGVEYSGADSLLIILAIFPVAAIFCEDWESGIIKFTLARSGGTRYAFAVTFTSAVSSGLCMFLSYILFSLFILTRHQLVPNAGTEELINDIFGFPNSELLLNGKPILCYFLYYLTRSAMTAFYAALAILQSIIVTNRRFAIISPVMMELLLSFIFGSIGLPSYLDPLALFTDHLGLYRDFGGDLESISFSPLTAAYPVIYCAVALIAISFAVFLLLKSKVAKEL